MGILCYGAWETRSKLHCWLALFMTYGDVLWLMGFNLLIYNEKTSKLFCFSSKRIPSILVPPPPPPLLIQCGLALLTHTSSEGWMAITIKVLWEVYARLRLVGYSGLFCPSVWRGEERGSKKGGEKRGIRGIKNRGRVGFSQKPVWGHFCDVQCVIYNECIYA